MIQLKAVNPRKRQVFKKLGCSEPIIMAGFSGKETYKNLKNFAITPFLNILRGCEKLYMIRDLPNTKIKLDWVFLCGKILDNK